MIGKHRAGGAAAGGAAASARVAGPLWVLFGAVARRAAHRLRQRRATSSWSAPSGGSASWPCAAPSAPRAWQLFRAQMAEAVVVAVLAGVLAVVLAWVSVPLYLRFVPPDVPRIGDVARGLRHAAVHRRRRRRSAALLCGLLPALRASEPSLDRLRDGSRGSTARRHWARDGLVVAQTALALVLLIGSALLLRSFSSMRNVDPGYDTRDIFTFQIAPEGGDAHRTAASYARFHLAFMDRLAALPGVESVGIVDNVPLNEGTARRAASSRRSARARPTAARGSSFNFVGGRLLLDHGDPAARGPGVHDGRPVHRPGKRRHQQVRGEPALAGAGSPIGRRLKREDIDVWETVVGVVEDVMQDNFRDPPPAAVYFPLVGPAARRAGWSRRRRTW